MQREEGELQAEQPTVQANSDTPEHLKQEEQWEEEEEELQAVQLNEEANAGMPEHLREEAAQGEQQEGAELGGQQEEEEVELQAEQLNGQADAGTLEHLGQEAALREEREGQESYDDLDSALCACHAQADVQDGEVMRDSVAGGSSRTFLHDELLYKILLRLLRVG